MKMYALKVLREMAKEAKLSVDQVATVLEISEREETAANNARRASSAERVALFAKLTELVDKGVDLSSLSNDEILAEADVPRKQGTASIITRFKRQALLTTSRAA